MKKNPPFRADHVGSLLRTPELQKAREQYKTGAIKHEELAVAEDESINQIVKIQEDAGLTGITDGEQRRTFFHVDFLDKIEGVSVSIASYEIKFKGGNKEISQAPPILSVTGKLQRSQGLATGDFKYLKSQLSSGHIPKICIPSPSMLHFRGGRSSIDATAYPDLDDFFADLAAIYREEIAELYELGCRYLQLDDTNLAYLCDPDHRERVKALGEDPGTLPGLYARLITECVKERPDDMTVGIHLCRGNYRSAWAAEGGYEPVAEVLFNETGVDVFFLEYDDARSGDFSPLRFVPKEKCVVLGLVSTKLPELESKDSLKKRIEEAAEFIDLDRCCLSPQCGFSSTYQGNNLTFDEQSAKLKLVVEVASEVWS